MLVINLIWRNIGLWEKVPQAQGQGTIANKMRVKTLALVRRSFLEFKSQVGC